MSSATPRSSRAAPLRPWSLLAPLFCVVVVGLSLPSAAGEREEVTLGRGAHRYRWVPDWGDRPDDLPYGNTHGCLLVDRAGRVYFNTDTERAVMIFEADGTYVDSWGKELAGGLHGMTRVVEDGKEVLYLAHIGRHQVFKATLEGEILWQLGYPEESGLYENAGQYRPTAIAVAPDGDFFVADGYGKSYVHHYRADRTYVRSFGGPGTEPGKLRTPHGLWLDTRGAEPQLIVADRENHRLQFFDLEGNWKSLLDHDLRRPCNVSQRGNDLLVADLAGRVTLFDGKNQLITHLGDNPREEQRAQNGVPVSDWQAGVFLSPHSACFDADGNIYVMDWNAAGRISKLELAPAED